MCNKYCNSTRKRSQESDLRAHKKNNINVLHLACVAGGLRFGRRREKGIFCSLRPQNRRPPAAQATLQHERGIIGLFKR